MSKKRNGFVLIPIILVVSIVAVLFFLKPYKKLPFSPISISKTTCPEPFIFELPVDISKATSILYPGQIRGGEFKAHGGFRFDDSLPEEITVKAPIDAYVIAGARYPGTTGDIQYTFDFEHPCGVRYRFGHLLTLSPKFQAIAEKFPLPKDLDSRTTQVDPPIEVKKGEIIATAVGLTKEGNSKNGTNTFLDWGVYDYKQQNEASKDPGWATKHTEDPNWSKYYNSETYKYAVCWFDWISESDKQKVLSLPSSDGQSGKTSDYCKSQ